METNLYPTTGLMQPLTNPSVPMMLRANVVMPHMQPLLAIGLMQPSRASLSIAGSIEGSRP